MITRRAAFLVPCVAALALVGLPAAGTPTPTPPPPPVGVGEPVVVVDGLEGLDGREAMLTGIEVARRSITWGALTRDLKGELWPAAEDPQAEMRDPEDEVSPARVSSRAYTPDLGKAGLVLGEPMTPAIEGVPVVATTQEWVVGFDPYVSRRPRLLVRHDGGAQFTIALDGDVSSRAAVAVWGDTALVGPYAVNLSTREVFYLNFWVGDPDEDCLGWRPPTVLADGLLLVRNECTGTVQALEVPSDGLTADVLDDGWVTVLDEAPQMLAYSQGLLAFGSGGDFRVVVEGDEEPVYEWELGYLRLDEPGATVRRQVVEGFPLAVRAQGRRIVAVTGAPWSDVALAIVVEEGSDRARAVVPLAGPMLAGEELPPVTDGAEGAEGATVVRDPSSDMGADGFPVDLYGRTIAWFTGSQILAATLPPLEGGPVTASVPSTAKAATTMTVAAAGLLPGEEVAVWFESDPVLLALGTADADGAFTATVTVPAAAAAGVHTLTVHGVESGWSSVHAITLAAAGNPGLRVDTGR